MGLQRGVFECLNNINITQLFNHLVLVTVDFPVVSNGLSKLTRGLVILGLNLLPLVGKKPHEDLTIDGIFLHGVDLLSHFSVLLTFLLSVFSFLLSDLIDFIISRLHGLSSIKNRVLEFVELCRFDVGVFLLSKKVDGFHRKIELGE